ncbi:type II/IV secretion system secretin rcpA/cpaC [Vibrio sp. JCM 19236]|nr:type II/IV secretion system secretin rcpA/cpaC [Vibrio sp. JCM 19236]
MENRITSRASFSILALLLLLFSVGAWSGDRYITLNDAKHIQLSEPIGKVFISNPDVADYKVMNDNTVVVFANSIGQARLLVYGVSEKVLLSDRIVVDLNLTQVRRQIDFYYPSWKLNWSLLALRWLSAV